jgi:hypothetical protein
LLLHIDVYDEPVRDGSTQGHEAKRTGECGGSSKAPYHRYYSFSVNQSIDYPHKCKFGFHSVLANTLKQLDMIQGLGSTSLSNRLPSLRSIDCSHASIARSVDCSIDELATDPLSRSHPLHTKQVPRRRYQPYCCRRCKWKPSSSNCKCKLRDCKPQPI